MTVSDDHARKIAALLLEKYGKPEDCLMLLTLARAHLMREQNRIPKAAPKLHASGA